MLDPTLFFHHRLRGSKIVGKMKNEKSAELQFLPPSHCKLILELLSSEALNGVAEVDESCARERKHPRHVLN